MDNGERFSLSAYFLMFLSMVEHVILRILCCFELAHLRRLTGLAILALLVLFSLAILTEPVSAAKKIAFVVGIDKCKFLGDDKQLDNPVYDARGVASKLRKLGFEVTTGENLTRKQFNSKWQDVLEATTSEDTLTFYFSGHGVEVDGQNFLLPHDIPFFKSSRHTQLKRESISVAELLADLRTGDRVPPKVTVMILDACRDDPTLSAKYKKGLGAKGGLAKIPVPQGTFIMYAASPGKVSLDRLGFEDKTKNSVFTRTLLPLLGTPNQSIQDLAIKVKQDVYTLSTSESSPHEQIPEYTDGIIGRFCLAGCQESALTFTRKSSNFDEKESQEAIREQMNSMQAGELAVAAAGLQDVFFEFGLTLTQEGEKSLDHTVKWLEENVSAKLLIEGHCDAREAKANNCSIGETRAHFIWGRLVGSGITRERISVISDGQGKPFCSDPTDVCYQLNRRVHLLIENY